MVVPSDSSVDIGSPCYSRHLHCFFPAVLRAFEPAQTLEDQAKKKDRYTVYQQGGPTQVLDRRSVVFEVDPMIAICVVSAHLVVLTPARSYGV